MAKKNNNFCKDPEGCNQLRMPNPAKPGKFFPLCREHQIASVLSEVRAGVVQSKAELEKMRLELKNEAKRGYKGLPWIYFSRFILLSSADANLMVRCSTNPELVYNVTDKRIAGGHYFRSNLYPAVMYDIRNVLPQSSQENNHFAGNQEKMGVAIERKFGQGTIAALDAIKDGPMLTDSELVSIKEMYSALLKDELKRRGIKNPWIKNGRK